MPAQSSSVFEPLGKHHDRVAFDCGIEALNRYLREQAGQDTKKKVAATFVLAAPTLTLPLKGEGGERQRAGGGELIAGYYTLSSTSVNVGELPEQVAKKLPRYPLMPATLIGRLAVDRRYQGKGCGELLLVDALKRSLISTKQIGSVAVVVDAKDDAAKAFYQHFQFITLVNYSHRLFLPMAVVERYFNPED